MKNTDFGGDVLYNFEPGFGEFAIYEFGIGAITRVSENEDMALVKTFPNPVKDKLQVYLHGEAGGKVTLQLTSSTGAVVFTRTTETGNGDFRTEINTSALPAGAYLLRVESEGFSVVKKVVKN